MPERGNIHALLTYTGISFCGPKMLQSEKHINKREMTYIDLWRTVLIVLTYGM